MDKILAFLKEAKWFSISIAIFMVIWLGPKLLDSIEEYRIEAEQEARIEQREIAQQEQLKIEAIEKEERRKRAIIQEQETTKRLAAEKIQRKRRLAADEIAIAKRLATEKIIKDEEAKQKVLKEKKLKDLEIGLVCRAKYPGRYTIDGRETVTLLIELILIRDLSENIVNALSVRENLFEGTNKTTKEFASANSEYTKRIKVSDVNFQIHANAQLYTASGNNKGEKGNYMTDLFIDRASLNFKFDTAHDGSKGRCVRKNAQLIRLGVEAYNYKNKSATQL